MTDATTDQFHVVFPILFDFILVHIRYVYYFASINQCQNNIQSDAYIDVGKKNSTCIRKHLEKNPLGFPSTDTTATTTTIIKTSNIKHK